MSVIFFKFEHNISKIILSVIKDCFNYSIFFLILQFQDFFPKIITK